MSAVVPSKIFEPVREIMARSLVVDITQIWPDSILKDFGADSLDFQDMLMEIEEKFGCRIPDVESGSWKTVADVVESIERNYSGPGAGLPVKGGS